jgi:putative methionine-R-sulfoxide reductase with GAF domain
MVSRYSIDEVNQRLSSDIALPSSIVDALTLSLEPVTESEVSELSRYRVPKLGNEEDGTCGVGLEKEPFEILEVLVNGLETPRSKEKELFRLQRLKRVLAALKEASTADWIGVYENTLEPKKKEFEQLLKLTYLGAPSRAYFPLTEDFAKNSNNSTSCLRKQCIVIHDVGRATSSSTPYYVCDGRVQSEVCAPILTSDGTCIGLIDCESFKSENFTDEKVNIILQTAKALSESNLFR